MAAVVYELVKSLLELLASHVGVEGVAIGGLAAVVVGLWYLREAADAFVVLARYSRVLSLIGFVVLVLAVVGTYSGVVDVGSAVSAVGQFVNRVSEVLH
ncbi:hypothetical protein EGH21_12595 [Halomicroarcula sp. F13]|uniref:Uncharacterized protein n=1 Tax=Haloarcula rubra TaxID=2487747 RepID=A0AAW4PRV8_9EURY|nr:hypothetical protein [Halomicroarcula rubra]MBX0323869.1 hypothetical protein [Halomicroarcula rubra]